MAGCSWGATGGDEGTRGWDDRESFEAERDSDTRLSLKLTALPVVAFGGGELGSLFMAGYEGRIS